MVEAAVVLPVMLVFLGVMAIAYGAAKARLLAQQDARASVMYYATNDCDKRMGSDETTRARSAGQSLPTPPRRTGGELGEAAAGGSMDARASLFFAEGQATRTATVYGRSRTATSQSWALCNESPNTGNLAGLTRYAFDLFGGALPAPIRRAAR